MKTITINAYEFNELSAEAKQRVYNSFLEDNVQTRSDMFFEDVTEELSASFPNSDAKLQFSLSSCQGDGVNVYGEFNLFDVLNLMKDKLQSQDFEKLENYFSNLETANDSFIIPCNNRYCYSLANKIDFASDIVDDFLERGYDKNDLEIIVNFEKMVKEYFLSLCRELENRGYDALSVTMEDVAEDCECNEWFFDEYGKLL